eukprot:TRINITY_DN790_c1_g1_i1.p1 TRINITY_DN790_c1_g1~~TRINITY_DN790_c1_g1_i1.p1  ORF type:complete len:428 (+),score=47.47 TRINITY_DN790_c1_g1_i1:37-1284(+)
MANIIRTAVSRKKRRYQKNGYDLDLAYITDRIIAMGFPSEGIEGAYRNPYEEVIKFLDEMHKDHYKVYNLCSERDYPTTHFYGRVGRYPFDDHNAPPFDLLEIMCKDVKAYLDAHEKNVVVIHCKAGKGRTGVLICCALLYSRVWNRASDALDYYGAMRTYNKKGVTIPSQRRYVGYFADYLRYGQIETQPLVFKYFTMHMPPKFFADLEYMRMTLKGPCPERKVYATTKFTAKEWFKSMKQQGKTKGSEGLKVELPTPHVLSGDVKVEIYEKERGLGTSEKLIFSLWVSTNFVEPQRGVIIRKPELDKGLKDKRLDDGFYCEIMFDADPNSKNGRRRSVLTQLLSSKTTSQRQILLDDEASDQSTASLSKGSQDSADLDILGDPEVRASEGSVSQIPADPVSVMLDKFPSLHHF